MALIPKARSVVTSCCVCRSCTRKPPTRASRCCLMPPISPYTVYCMPWATITSTKRTPARWRHWKPASLPAWVFQTHINSNISRFRCSFPPSSRRANRRVLSYPKNFLKHVPWTMSDPNSPDPEPRQPKTASKSLFARVTAFMRPLEPEDRDDVREFLDAAHEKKILDSEAYTMLSGVLDVANQTVADIMVPRSKMDMLDIGRPLSEVLPDIIETGHSRFPVYEGDRDNIVGILLAKDLLLSITNPQLDLRPLVRPAVFIPETKRLNVLLREFRSSRNHLAIVIDEHGGTAGLVTMEDVLEQIVGEIEDEYDEDAEKTIF